MAQKSTANMVFPEEFVDRSEELRQDVEDAKTDAAIRRLAATSLRDLGPPDAPVRAEAVEFLQSDGALRSAQLRVETAPCQWMADGSSTYPFDYVHLCPHEDDRGMICLCPGPPICDIPADHHHYEPQDSQHFLPQRQKRIVGHTEPRREPDTGQSPEVTAETSLEPPPKVRCVSPIEPSYLTSSNSPSASSSTAPAPMDTGHMTRAVTAPEQHPGAASSLHTSGPPLPLSSNVSPPSTNDLQLPFPPIRQLLGEFFSSNSATHNPETGGNISQSGLSNALPTPSASAPFAEPEPNSENSTILPPALMSNRDGQSGSTDANRSDGAEPMQHQSTASCTFDVAEEYAKAHLEREERQWTRDRDLAVRKAKAAERKVMKVTRAAEKAAKMAEKGAQPAKTKTRKKGGGRLSGDSPPPEVSSTTDDLHETV